MAAAILLAAALPLAPGITSMARAGGGLVTVSDTTYRVLPEDERVGVTIDSVSTSLERDTAQGQIYYTGLTMFIQAGATSIRGSSEGAGVGVRVLEATDEFTKISVNFSRNVFYQQSYAYRISFDLVDPGGEANRDLRIGRSMAAFGVWAFGDPGTTDGSVRVILPPSWNATVYGEVLDEAPQPDGTTVLSAAPLADPGDWFAYVVAERPGSFQVTDFDLAVGDEVGTVRLRAWDDDPEWAARMQILLSDGIPALHELIGLAWPVHGELKVEESAIRRLGEYAGVYNRLTELINVRYDADAIVALHEVAHAWFNDGLFRDRWIGEAFAEFYAVHAAEQIGARGDVFELTDELVAGKVALNDWGVIGAETDLVERYAYAATYHLAELIFERTDHDVLRSVWRAAEDGFMSYQPAEDQGSPVIGVPFDQPGWQRLLDLLEERTDAAFADLWLEYVVSAGQRPLLDDRAEARDRYHEVADAAGEWQLPTPVRYAMSSWEFDEALAELGMASQVLDLRDDLTTLGVSLDLTPPDALREAFEGADGMAAAQAEATAELGALELIEGTTTRLASEPGFVESVGLLLTDPAAGLATARDAWEAGDSDAAAEDARVAMATRDGAEAVGRDRLLVGGGLLLIGTGGGAVLAIRRRRRVRAPLDRPA